MPMAKVESGARQWQETQEHASPCLSGGGMTGRRWEHVKRALSFVGSILKAVRRHHPD